MQVKKRFYVSTSLFLAQGEVKSKVLCSSRLVLCDFVIYFMCNIHVQWFCTSSVANLSTLSALCLYKRIQSTLRQFLSELRRTQMTEKVQGRLMCPVTDGKQVVLTQWCQLM